MTVEQLDPIFGLVVFVFAAACFIAWICRKTMNPYADKTEEYLNRSIPLKKYKEYEEYLKSDQDYATWKSLRS